MPWKDCRSQATQAADAGADAARDAANGGSSPDGGVGGTLQAYLDKNYAKVKTQGKLGLDLGQKTHVPISIFLRSRGTSHVYAGKFDEEMHYSASLIKVAAMFAAYKLRKEASLLVDEIKNGSVVANNSSEFFSKLEAKLNLSNTLPVISSASGINKKPLFTEILNVTGFGNSATLMAKFTDDFRTHMRKMIIPSDNCSAGECIRRLSYPYINVSLMQDNFFDRGSMKGIWLCGDYIQDFCFNKDKKQLYILIDTVNDCNEDTNSCGSAQVATSKQMSRFFLMILLGQLVDSASSVEMRELLREAQQGTPPGTPPPVFIPAPDPSFLSRPGTIPLLFDVNNVKIGQGPIKKDTQRGIGLEVRSEGLIIKWTISSVGTQQKFDRLNLTGEAAICWQNFSNQLSVNGIVEIINTSISDFINQVPLIP